jgi:hypothetical protein
MNFGSFVSKMERVQVWTWDDLYFAIIVFLKYLPNRPMKIKDGFMKPIFYKWRRTTPFHNMTEIFDSLGIWRIIYNCIGKVFIATMYIYTHC